MLIISYIITVIFALSGFQALSIPGILFGICYLPGFAMLAFIKKESLKFEDLLLAFPISIGISSLSVFGLLYAGVQVKFVSYIIIGIIGIVILMFSVKSKKVPALTVKLSGEEIRFAIVAFLMTLIFSIPVVSERIAVSAHGLHHFTLVSQILNGIFPPENPGLGGTPVSYHWGYHALVAALSAPTDFHPLRIISVLNVMSLFIIFCIAYSAAKYLNFSEGNSYLVSLALIGLMRSDAVIFLANKLSSGYLMSLRQETFTEIRPSEILQGWIWGGGAPWFDRRMLYLNKFYNANTMPLGMALCLSYFFFLLVSLKRTNDQVNYKSYMPILGLLIVAGCIIYPPLAIITLLHAPIWAGVAFFFKRTDFKAGLKDASAILMPYCLAVALALPYLLSVSSNTGEPVIRIKFCDQSIINLVSFWLPMPFILAGFFLSFRKLPPVIFYFLTVASLVCLGLSVFTEVALNNSEKFTFILSFFYALYFVLATSSILNTISSRRASGILSAVLVLFLLITPVITEAAYIISPWFSDNTYSFSGRHTLLAQDSERNEAFIWLRDHTPPEALVMLSYVETSNPDTIAQNSTYEPAALSERNLFVIKDWYTVSNPEFRKRISIREKLLMNYSDSEARDFFKSLKRPVYLLVEDKLPPLYLTDKIFRDFPANPEGWLPVFRNKRQTVYLKR